MSEKYVQTFSVSDANEQLVRWRRTNSENKDLPDQIVRTIDEKENEITGNSNDYHNLASEFARKDMYDYATVIANAGVRKYRFNVDLLADVVKFGSQSQKWEDCKLAFDRLSTIDKKRWTWRTFTFVIDYLLERMDQEEPKDFEAAFDVVLKFIEEYKKINDERAWAAEADLYLLIGERNKVIDVLKEGIKRIKVAPQCCLKLADIMLESGEYSETIKYASIGIRGTAQDQPTASTGYLYYISALAKDALIHQNSIDNSDKVGFGDSRSIEDALLDYSIAKQLLMGNTTYISNINQREVILIKKYTKKINNNSFAEDMFEYEEDDEELMNHADYNI